MNAPRWIRAFILAMTATVAAQIPVGSLINAGQPLTRMDALRLYTAENGWFLKEESTIRRPRSVLTVVDGTVVHDTLTGPGGR
jgi:hypothetical protein